MSKIPLILYGYTNRLIYVYVCTMYLINAAVDLTPVPLVFLRMFDWCSSTSNAPNTYSFLIRNGLECFVVSSLARPINSRAASR